VADVLNTSAWKIIEEEGRGDINKGGPSAFFQHVY
jgi:hypothetical protein